MFLTISYNDNQRCCRSKLQDPARSG
ncbi:MAG: hypothetical protein CVU49_00355 [Candidatus Cloacimonetes bacterium HGW-Cloacimonetes-2]|nr:MAG: hypothetical protein CVU49_00355 [Candidatus Cloacimonetes bacterium HGW-Cloacimonetes-2]